MHIQAVHHEPVIARLPAQPSITRLAGFQSKLEDLAATRGRLESLRRENGPLDERADLIDHLHELRAELGRARLDSTG